MLCVAMPFVLLNAALWGVIAAFQRFREANLVNMPILACYYLGPLLVLHFVDSLVAVMAVLVACRIVLTACYWRLCVRELPALTPRAFCLVSRARTLQARRMDDRIERGLADPDLRRPVRRGVRRVGRGGRLLHDAERSPLALLARVRWR